MTDALFSAVEVSAPTDARPGYRLQRLEVYNWGTFDGQVYTLDLDGADTLLTGDIGSGKSTLVDAVTTLLLRADRINYNKAAGADTRERSLRSYVLGHYKSERSETTGVSRAVGLRDHRSYSVILGVFTNEGYDAQVSLAQVFWMREASQGQPDRLFVTADRALSIAGDFADFGHEMSALRRQLREGGCEVADHFPAYGTRVRRLLGIGSEQAMDLFHQTISMKSVGNLTDFVRQHMLEGAPDTQDRISRVISHVDDLTRAHDAVREARDQLAGLDPLLEHCDRYDEQAAAAEAIRATRRALPYWLAERTVDLAAHELARLATERVACEREAAEVQQEREARTGLERRLERDLEGAGGGRLREIAQLVQGEQRRRDERRARAEQHGRLLEQAGMEQVRDSASFHRSVEERTGRREQAGARLDDLDTERTDLAVDRRECERDSERVNAELRSLRGRQSNIDSRQLSIRADLAQALGLDEVTLPFAGELIQVRPEHEEWRGAAERVLRPFALSLLVPDEAYDRVTAWVADHHLGARLVYYRVPARIAREADRRPRGGVPSTTVGAPVLAELLELREGVFTAWLDRELRRRAAHVCVHRPEELRQHHAAVTITGLVKAPGDRHEKDDRHRVDDRTRWVLGWSNADKIDALLDQASTLQQRLTLLRERHDAVQQETEGLRQIVSRLDQLAFCTDFAELDWRSSAAAITALQDEQRELREGSTQLDDLERRLEEVRTQIQELAGRDRLLQQRLGAVHIRTRQLEATLGTAQALLDELTGAPDEGAARAAYPQVEEVCGVPGSLEEIPSVEQRCALELDARLERHTSAQARATGDAVRAMAGFRQAWPTVTLEMDASIEARDTYRELRDRLRGDDLPRFEAEFKRQLNTNTIHEIASLQAWLETSRRQISQRIDQINDSLRAIEYNPGRLIRLDPSPTPHQDVRAFREELRACTDDALSQDDQYSEERFLRVKALVDRFRGREGMTEADRRWTAMVTDVRTWFTFAASERWKETGEEWEHYTDSDGKSGGQKEKLAYTILAASLAYQFRLEWGVRTSKDFRFVVIDEAFGRGSDASTRFALELFKRLGLQLLIVTPLQKVHVIEPYVQAIGFVDNRTGERSRLRTLTIKDYHEHRREHEALGARDQGGG